jgi:hypothetical protein
MAFLALSFSVMDRQSLRFLVCVLALALPLAACSVSNTGITDIPDARTSANGLAPCPANLADRADWPGGVTPTTCKKPCGPDDIGTRTCGSTDTNSCRNSAGCVCQQGPCVSCGDCSFVNLASCYVPTNTNAIPDCADTVEPGTPCAPSCSKSLCLRADGKTGCICNPKGTYACAAWNGWTWK